ncbi:MAG: hypothetical protein GX368_08760 [Erysipelotrichaceae bacterium]|nr:hypothetical protein [Erysipelotrichaceae bacterium]
MLNKQYVDNNVEQGIAAYIDYLNNIRLKDLMDAIELILITETEKLSDLSTRSANALANLDWAKIEINNLVEINRGGDDGIHGFIAEFAETGIRNAKDVFQGLQKSVILLNNNSPADLLLQGKEVQMKFYNNILDEIKQSSYYRDMIMIFPKDHVEVIDKIMNGAKTVKYNGNVLSNTQINNIKKLIEDESALRGVSYDKWLEPSVLKYKDVQKNVIDKTLSLEEQKIKKQVKIQKTEIKKEADKDRLIAEQKAQPSFQEASKVAGIGAAVQGGVNLGIFIYKKHKDGKEVWDFDVEDWKQCGISVGEGAIKGGVSGYAIYGLTNVCGLSAPSAGAITSGFFGLSNAVIKFRKGEVDVDGFIELVTLNAVDSTGAAIGAAIGQAVIPIPVVGSLIGSIVVTTSLNLGKDILNKREIEAINLYREKVNKYIESLDEEYRVILDKFLDEFKKLGELQKFSFDLNNNIQLRFVSSINLAKSLGVPEKKILKNTEEIDKYFLS